MSIHKPNRSLYILSIVFLLFTLSCVQPGSFGETAIQADSTPQEVFTPNSSLNVESDPNTGTDLVDVPAATQSTFEQDATAADRGRVRIVNNNLVADSGIPLRGEHIPLSNHPSSGSYDFALMYDTNHWMKLRDEFHLNTVRLMVSRPPQNWGGGPGSNCTPPTYRCYDLDHVFPSGRTTLQVIDDMVEIASQLGMYIIIDYHPVGGYDEADATSWWSQVAPRYKDRTHVIYEVANEPVQWQAESYDTKAVAFQENMYHLIRSAAPETHIILWTFAQATPGMLGKVNEAPGISYEKASVAFHPYVYDENAVLALRGSYPIFNSEIGAPNHEEYINRTQNAENIGVSWIWLGGARTGDLGPNGFTPEEVYWPGDPDAGGVFFKNYLPILFRIRAFVLSFLG